MRRTRLLTLVLCFGLAFACLVPPALNGKVCVLDGGGCTSPEACVTSVAGHGLGLPGPESGLCAPTDSGCAGLSCPEDAGLYICRGGTCFAEGDGVLGGLPCWTGLGRCRAEGLYLWEQDGGTCLTDGTNLQPQPECRLDGGYILRCACDGVDNDCDGIVNNVPPRPSFTVYPALSPGACNDGDGGVDLAAIDAGPVLGDSPSGGCAVFDLHASYAVASVAFESSVVTSACGAPSGATVFAQLFEAETSESGYGLVGSLPGAAGSVSIGQRVTRLALCVPPGSTYSALRVRSATITPAQECDTLPPGS